MKLNYDQVMYNNFGLPLHIIRGEYINNRSDRSLLYLEGDCRQS
ncbi:MAG: hypothetical protein ACI8YQ_001897 [Polaribacter sp.]|jgi:hypothetical protein